MTSIEQFMAQYFLDRTKIKQAEIELLSPHRQSYFASGCRWDSRQGVLESSRAEKIVSVSQAETVALVTTTGLHNNNTFPLRYHLHPTGDGWVIHDVEFQCPGCHGTGIGVHGGGCQICGGKGWKGL